MYFLYSSRVVAPIQRSSPRARAGFSMFAASTAPSAAPAPTSVCSSSMKRMTSPFASSMAFMTAFRRSSNSPRYLAPAIRRPKSRAWSFLFFRESGTSPEMILWARPSTIAVFPTPGSPIRTGLFLVLLDRTCMIRRISSSRPITGSSFPDFAFSIRLIVNWFRGSFISSWGVITFIFWLLLNELSAFSLQEMCQHHCSEFERFGCYWMILLKLSDKLGVGSSVYLFF